MTHTRAQVFGGKLMYVTVARRLPGTSFRAWVLAIAFVTSLADVDARPLASAPGMYIGTGSHQLHLHCTGDGAPSVVLESGLGGNSLDWSRVQPLVARFTRVCSYDRAGYGWSEPGAKPRTARQIAAELYHLLVYGSFPPPYVLVGHSFGGLVVQLFASLHPSDTAGLVLVDSTHEEQFERFERAGIRKTFLPTGRRFYISNHHQIPKGLPETVRPVAEALVTRSSAVQALYNELRLMRRSTRQVRASGPLPEVPVVVITRKNDARQNITESDRMAVVWLQMQKELASRSRRGVLIVADTEDHYIHLGQPEVVVDGIRSVVRTSRGSH